MCDGKAKLLSSCNPCYELEGSAGYVQILEHRWWSPTDCAEIIAGKESKWQMQSDCKDEQYGCRNEGSSRGWHLTSLTSSAPSGPFLEQGLHWLAEKIFTLQWIGKIWDAHRGRWLTAGSWGWMDRSWSEIFLLQQPGNNWLFSQKLLEASFCSETEKCRCVNRFWLCYHKIHVDSHLCNTCACRTMLAPLLLKLGVVYSPRECSL